MNKIQLIDTQIDIKPLVSSNNSDYEKSIAVQAWNVSRPLSTATSEEVFRTDAPVTDFTHLALRMTVPNFIREIIVSMRDHIVWSTTTRANPVDKAWPVFGKSENEQEYNLLAEKLLDEKSKGLPQDQFRLNLPLGYCGEFSIKISLRSAAKLIKYFEYLYTKTSLLAFLSFNNKFRSCIGSMGFKSELNSLLKYIEPVRLLSEASHDYNLEVRQVEFSSHNNLVSLSGVVPIALRTHLIRHRSLIVIDNLFELIKTLRIESAPINSNMYLSAFASREIWNHVIATRACWIAQGDLWNEIVHKYYNYFNLKTPPLPCSETKICPYESDNKLRIQERDPNPECPKYCELAKIETSHQDAINEHLKSKLSWWSIYKK